MKVPEEVKDKLTSRGIKLIIERTDEACQVFNRRVDSEEVAGALHLAC